MIKSRGLQREEEDGMARMQEQVCGRASPFIVLTFIILTPYLLSVCDTTHS